MVSIRIPPGRILKSLVEVKKIGPSPYPCPADVKKAQIEDGKEIERSQCCVASIIETCPTRGLVIVRCMSCNPSVLLKLLVLERACAAGWGKASVGLLDRALPQLGAVRVFFGFPVVSCRHLGSTDSVQEGCFSVRERHLQSYYASYFPALECSHAEDHHRKVQVTWSAALELDPANLVSEHDYKGLVNRDRQLATMAAAAAVGQTFPVGVVPVELA